MSAQKAQLKDPEFRPDDDNDKQHKGTERMKRQFVCVFSLDFGPSILDGLVLSILILSKYKCQN